MINSSLKNNKRNTSFLSNPYFLILLAIVLIVISVYLWKSQEARLLASIQVHTESKVRTYASETEVNYRIIYNALQRLGNKGTAIDVIESDDWKNDAALYINSFNGIKNIAWVDQSFRIKWITPLPENEENINKIANDVPGELSDVSLWMPSYDGLKFNGYLLATINIEDLFAPVFSDIKNDYMIKINNEGATIFLSENWDDPNQDFLINRTVTLQDTTVLNIIIAPTNDLISSEVLNAKKTLITSLLFSLILLIAVYFAQSYNKLSILNELRLKNTLESMVQGCQIIGHDWRYIFVNDTAADQNQRSKDELIGRTVMECFPDIKESDLFAMMKRCMDERIPLEMQNHAINSDGVSHWYEIKVEPAPDGILVLSNDVTERKHMNDALLESREHYRNLFESSKDGIFIADMEGNCLDANRAALEMVGYSISELRKLNVSDINASGEYPTFDRQRAWREGLAVEIIFKHKSGNTFPVDLSISPILVGEKQELILGIARDITQRKNAEKELEDYSNKLEEMVRVRTKALEQVQEELITQERLATLGQIAGSIGHELRNPLGVINNAIYFIHSILPDANEKVNEYIEIISAEVKKSSKIISDLLDFARIKPTQINAVAVTDAVYQTLEGHPAPENINLKTNIPDNLPNINVDFFQVGQIFTNLVSNAYQSMPDGGSLDITARQNLDYIYVSVKDTGVGICLENMKNLFKPLFTTKSRGIGLGLAISKKLAEANGGSIEVESKENEGSTFTLILPVIVSEGDMT